MKRQRRADPASVGLTRCQLHVPSRDPFTLNSVSIKPPLEVLSRQPAGSSSTPYVQHSLAHTRLTVKQTTVSAATKNKLRAGAEKAQKERSERKIVQLDSDPSLVKRGGKGKVGATKGKGKASAAAATASPAAAVPSHLRQEAGTASKPGSPSSRGTSPGDSRFGRMGTPSGLGRSGSRDPSAIPIRTRVLQLLALGPAKASDVAHRVRAPEEEVVQILQDVSSSCQDGRPRSLARSFVSSHASSRRPFRFLPFTGTFLISSASSQVALGPNPATGTWRLQNASYLLLDIHGWKQYSATDRQNVIAAASQAFDLLDIAKHAPERRILEPPPQPSLLKMSSPALTPGGSSSTNGGLGISDRRSASPLPPAVNAPSPAMSAGSSSSSSGSKKPLASRSTKPGKSVSIKTNETPSSATSKGKRKELESDSESTTSLLAKEASTSASTSKRRRMIDPSSLSSSTSAAPRPPSPPPAPSGKSSSKSKSGKVSSPKASSRSSSARRPSPTFTSSGASSPASTPHELSPPRSPSPPPPPPLPNSPSALRARFNAIYPDYSDLTARLEEERVRSEKLVRGENVSDVEKGMDEKEVARGARRRKLLHEELEEIKRLLRTKEEAKRKERKKSGNEAGGKQARGRQVTA